MFNNQSHSFDIELLSLESPTQKLFAGLNEYGIFPPIFQPFQLWQHRDQNCGKIKSNLESDSYEQRNKSEVNA